MGELKSLKVKAEMTTLKQQLQELYEQGWYHPIPSKENAVKMGVEHTLNCVKDWLKQKHVEWCKGFQYDEFFPKDVIPALLEELIGES